MATPTELIKERLNIVDILRSYIQLEKAGGNFRARCPFHNEKTPSFFISPTRQSYHCFGCNRGGDIFTFIQEIEGFDFPEALRFLADKAGVPLSEFRLTTDKAVVTEKEYLGRVLEIATRYFEKRLSENSVVLEYLTSRGLSEATIKKFRLGFAPAGWRNLTDFCIKQRVNASVLEKAGLSLPSPKNPGEYYDRFRSRIMFPICDREGKVIGFSGRIFGEEALISTEAKYVNTPQTLLYDKSRALYGYHVAKSAIRQKNTAVLVEGQMDLVMSHQAGIEEVVAVSGTALTELHLGLIQRLAGKLIMAFDADSAGIKASSRAVTMALSMGFEVAIARLPAGMDPADLVRESPDRWQMAVEEAMHVIDFYLLVIDQEAVDVPTKSRRIREDIYPLLSALSHKVDQAYFIRNIAEKLQIAEDAIWRDLEQFVPSSSVRLPSAAPPAHTAALVTTSRLAKVEERFAALTWALEEKLPAEAERYKKELQALGEGYWSRIESLHLDRKDQLLLEIDVLYLDKDLLLETQVVLGELKELKLREELSIMARLLKEAEQSGESELVDKYMKKCQDISNAITELTSKPHA